MSRRYMGWFGMRRAIDLPGAEERLGYTFIDKDLGTAALRTDRLGFSRLEYLGDAIMGLSVYTIAMCRDIPHPDIDRMVSNKNLDGVHRSHFAGCSSSETGDVVEALIAAIYLDGGFLSAAPVVASLLVSEHRDFDFATTQDLASTMKARQLFALGAQVSKAVIADHLSTTSPKERAHWYSSTSKSLLKSERLANICREHRLEDQALPNPPEPKWANLPLTERLADMVDGHFAVQYLTLGWSAAKANIATLLDVSATPRTWVQTPCATITCRFDSEIEQSTKMPSQRLNWYLLVGCARLPKTNLFFTCHFIRRSCFIRMSWHSCARLTPKQLARRWAHGYPTETLTFTAFIARD